MFEMWVNESGIANLLSIPQLEKDGFRVTSDTHRKWVVYTPQGEKIEFKHDTGLCKNMPYIDVRQFSKGFANANIKAHLEKRIQTVRKNMKGFSYKEVKQAELARIAQSKVAHPPDSKFKQMVHSPSFKNCPVTPKDITTARVIYGPDLPGLAVRSTRNKSKKSRTGTYGYTPGAIRTP